jgi:hypothetical protein
MIKKKYHQAVHPRIIKMTFFKQESHDSRESSAARGAPDVTSTWPSTLLVAMRCVNDLPACLQPKNARVRAACGCACARESVQHGALSEGVGQDDQEQSNLDDGAIGHFESGKKEMKSPELESVGRDKKIQRNNWLDMHQYSNAALSMAMI